MHGVPTPGWADLGGLALIKLPSAVIRKKVNLSRRKGRHRWHSLFFCSVFNCRNINKTIFISTRFNIFTSPNCVLCGSGTAMDASHLKSHLNCLDIYVTDTGRQERTSRSLDWLTFVDF
ncbi:hypothetical protein CEXT_178411 [Caerostris extrusa]|uniref:Uncharacterized protein n=1 Tax=Caerostris extrusa TaxID=172846 RepID=A0AAV4QJV8_CAEEX|nr:hypothetical protein CEXT_178411 [Caerostris extrusa]